MDKIKCPECGKFEFTPVEVTISDDNIISVYYECHNCMCDSHVELERSLIFCEKCIQMTNFVKINKVWVCGKCIIKKCSGFSHRAERKWEEV